MRRWIDVKRKMVIVVMVIMIIYGERGYIKGGNIWIDFYGTSSTSGTWNSGIRSDRETGIYPPYVIRWEKYEWRGDNINVVPPSNEVIIYNGYVYYGEGHYDDNTNDVYGEGYVWCWDIKTGVTRTGYPLGPLDSSIVADGGGLTIGENKLYAITQHKIYGWRIDTDPPEIINGFPVEITETAGAIYMTEYGIIYYRGKIYFGTVSPDANHKGYLYAKDGNTGVEIWRKEASENGVHTPTVWEGKLYCSMLVILPLFSYIYK